MKIILKHNFLNKISQNPDILFLPNIKQLSNKDVYDNFKLFIQDLFNDKLFYGKNALSNRTFNFQRKNIFTILNAKHYHLGSDITIDSDLKYKKKGNPMQRIFLDLFNKDYTQNYKTSDILINYIIDENDNVIIYNITKHLYWEALKNNLVLQNGGIAYLWCNNCNFILDDKNKCTCTKEIMVIINEVININDYSEVTGLSNISFSKDKMIPQNDYYITDNISLSNFFNYY